MFCVLTTDANVSERRLFFSGLFAYGVSIIICLFMFLFPQYPTIFFASFTTYSVITFFLNLRVSLNYKETKLLWIESVSSLLLGFTLWLIENSFCESVGFLKFHMLWHLFSAFGSHR